MRHQRFLRIGELGLGFGQRRSNGDILSLERCAIIRFGTPGTNAMADASLASSGIKAFNSALDRSCPERPAGC
jgi:hypothetical protein